MIQFLSKYLGLLLWFPVLLNAQSEAPFTFEKEGQTMELSAAMQRAKVNGISVALFRHGELDTLMQWGTKDAAQTKTVNAQTLFQAGSLTNALTKYLVVRLVEMGKIEFQSPVNNYLQSWQIPEKSFTKKQPVTVEDLLLQRRGFPTVSKPTGYQSGNNMPNLLQILNGDAPSQELAAIPRKHKNRGGNLSFLPNLVLQQLIEDVYQAPFAEVVQREIFDPLDMQDSYIAAELSADQKANASVGYTKDGKLIVGERWIYPELGAAGLWTTPLDYGKFVTHVQRAAAGLDNRFLSVELAQMGLSAQKAKDYRTHIFLVNKFGDPYWGGASMGFRTQFTTAKDGSWTVVAFMNAHEQWIFMAELMGQLIPFTRHRNRVELAAN
ncbi:MAG: serine hydrolase domain-containing protein [Bacteroidota bacterium]